ncbi:hypothetical protein EW146_g1811 [Bondarzewia mesenterica]|uniref:Ribokinase n=1 Tax=Bondarzewia mesenterica TaxID=1095465 RepID=A0A4S4M2R0_9AGAM|nr:hypothetical protein EW146_g1811 [Bondarzewia mesenterica]
MSQIPSHCLVRGSINIDEFFHGKFYHYQPIHFLIFYFPTYIVNDVVRPGETISSTKFERRAGGKGANQAAAVAQAGGRVSLVGAVGEDGKWVVNDLESMGVNVDSVSVVEGPTGRAIIQLTPAGENCIILHRGANFALEDLPDQIVSHLVSSTHILLQNEIPWSGTLAYLEHAHARGIITIFNPSPMPPADQIRSFPWTALSWLLVNEVEAEGLLNSLGSQPSPSLLDGGLSTPAEWPAFPALSATYPIVKKLSSHQCLSSTNVVCTIGPAGAIAIIPTLTDAIYVPAAKLQGDVRDTTGAGDCFTGYLIAGLMRLYDSGTNTLSQDNATDLLIYSTHAAGMCVEKRGALESIPRRMDVDARLG